MYKHLCKTLQVARHQPLVLHRCYATHRSSKLPTAPFPILQTVAEVRQWRMEKLLRGESVGFVPTMGCLHDGHLSLARHSLSATDHTIASIFVNPAQFAPHEDLQTYPQTLEEDIAKLADLQVPADALPVSADFADRGSVARESPVNPLSDTSTQRRISALFLPNVSTLYPSGIEQDVSKQVGTFVEVKGFSHQMEGRSRPTFFRGVATVVLKLFNIVQPDKAFFGQKDIQQSIVLRQMLRDLHLPHPSSPSNLVIIPTTRDPVSGLALSSRNTYLSEPELRAATCLSKALFEGKRVLEEQQSRGEARGVDILKAAEQVVAEVAAASRGSAEVKLDFISLNDPVTLAGLDTVGAGKGAILSGAIYCGKTRLIDNIVIGVDLNAM